MSGNSELAVETLELGRRYGRVTALEGVNLRVTKGSYFVLLGPSGGGKTTLLRLIGGLVRPSAGRVRLHGRDVTDLPANERPTTMVFQSYALFPHMSVARNVGFGLALRRVAKREVRERVDRMLDLVGLTGYQERMPHELSGGQQQRVQLARSLVLDRDVLLLDEPLAALDEKLRKEMCFELKRIQEQVGITFIHVTHNQEEAMTVADRIAIIASGRLIEEGSSREIYEHPARRFTAEFIGETKIFEGTVEAADGARARVDIGIGVIEVGNRDANVRVRDAVSISIRSELLELLAPDETASAAMQSVPATYEKTIYLGLTSSHRVRLPDGAEVGVRRFSGARGTARIEPGAQVRLAWHMEDARLHTS
ncbi:MAG: ABC transporter ATP-binding protein [Betaproteobacteria bacterium]|nr:ABC transporter ATP-binding protein [Betaproteobacteria bacterium]